MNSVCPHDLLSIATLYLDNAYAPYSGYRVAAALRDEDGRIFLGVNVENSSYGLTVCAERVAVFSAVSSGSRRFKELLIIARGTNPPLPCGACLQVLSEFNEGDLVIHVATTSGLCQSYRLSELLPKPFKLGEGRS